MKRGGMYSKAKEIPEHLRAVIERVFEVNDSETSSREYKFKSDVVLRIFRKDLEKYEKILALSDTLVTLI